MHCVDEDTTNTYLPAGFSKVFQLHDLTLIEVILLKILGCYACSGMPSTLSQTNLPGLIISLALLQDLSQSTIMIVSPFLLMEPW